MLTLVAIHYVGSAVSGKGFPETTFDGIQPGVGSKRKYPALQSINTGTEDMPTEPGIKKHRSATVRKMVSEIAEKIETGVLRPGDALPGAHALAREYGIGYSTVIHVYKTLSEAGLINTVRGSGAFVAGNTASINQIMLCMRREMHNPHSEWSVNDMLAGMSAAAQARGIRIEVVFTNVVGDKWRETIDEISDNTGVIFCWEAPPEWVMRLHKKEVPYAIVMPSTLGDWEQELPVAFPDYYGSVKRAVSELLDRGFQRFGFIGNPDDLHEGPRFRGFHDALHNRGLDVNQIIECPAISRHAGQVAMTQYLASQDRLSFDILVSANDLRALGAMDVLLSRGIRIPDDLAVLGFDDIPAAGEAELSTVRLDMHGLGERSINWFLDSVVAGDNHTPQQLVVDCPSVWRRSTDRI